ARAHPARRRGHSLARHAVQRRSCAQLLQRRAGRQAAGGAGAAHRSCHRQPRRVRRHARGGARNEAADDPGGAVIYGVGTDVVEIARIEHALARFGERFARRILSESEFSRFKNHRLPAAYLAKRLAAKEAFAKALGTGIHAPASWQGVWVKNLPSGQPVLQFSRNYENPQQLLALCEDLERLRAPALPACVDHEGGRVQRFREGFTAIPPMRELGRLWDRDREAAREAARSAAYVIAAELAAHGVDFSFAPVLDLDYGSCAAIGDRALHFDPNAVGALGACIVQGFAAAGMAAVGKHFPGHGFAPLDSHVEVPRDDRPLKDIFSKDVLPYRKAI